MSSTSNYYLKQWKPIKCFIIWSNENQLRVAAFAVGFALRTRSSTVIFDRGEASFIPYVTLIFVVCNFRLIYLFFVSFCFLQGFTAGGFIYIAVAGVLAEMNSNGNSALKTTAVQLTSLILGMSVALFISLVEWQSM